MKHSEFVIGNIFYCSGRQWCCTDIGSRVVIAIRIDLTNVVCYSPNLPEAQQCWSLNRSEATSQGWFNGPPYAVAEHVFDECDLPACTLEEDAEP